MVLIFRALQYYSLRIQSTVPRLFFIPSGLLCTFPPSYRISAYLPLPKLLPNPYHNALLPYPDPSSYRNLPYPIPYLGLVSLQVVVDGLRGVKHERLPEQRRLRVVDRRRLQDIDRYSRVTVIKTYSSRTVVYHEKCLINRCIPLSRTLMITAHHRVT